MLWLALAHAADKTAVCKAGDTEVVLEPHVFTDVRGAQGKVAPEGLRGELPGGLVAELRYEHAYAATFVILQLSKGGEMVARSTTWLSAQFDHGTNGTVDGPPTTLPLGAITLEATVDQRAWVCNGNFL